MSVQRRTSLTRESSSPEVDLVRVVKQEPKDDTPLEWNRKSVSGGQVVVQDPPTAGVFDRLLSFCCAAVMCALKYLLVSVKYTWVPILACWLLLAAAAAGSHGLVSIQGALHTHAPFVCDVPLIPTGLLCLPSDVPSDNRSLALGFPQLMKIEVELLQTIFEEAAGISADVWDMNRAHVAAGSLLRLIKASSFPSKGLLSSRVEELETKLDSVGVALHDLHQEFESCVQSTINVNDFALRTIAADRGTFLERYLPGYNGRVRPIVRESFALTLDVFFGCLGGVFVVAQDAAMQLSSLNGTLGAIHHINSLHGASFAQQQDELAGSFWTFVGGNRRLIRTYDDHLLLVGQISNYRTKSATHVNRTIITVVALKEQLTTLRDSLATADDPYPDMSSEHVEAQLYHIRATMALAMDLLIDGRADAERFRSEALREARVCH